MYVTVLCILIAITIAIYKHWLYQKKIKYVEKLPGPKTYPIVGNMLEFGRNYVEFFENIQRLYKKYGRIMRYWVGPFSPTILISDPKLVESVLGSSVHINKSKSYNLLKCWLGDGLLMSKGDKWRRDRKILTPTFHYKILEDFVPVFYKNIDILIKKVKENNEEKVNFLLYSGLLTLDIICETSMGLTIDAQNNPDLQYVNAARGFLSCNLKRFFSLFMRNDFTAKYFQTYKEQMEHVNVLKSFVDDVIQKRKQERNANIQKDKKCLDEFGIKNKTAFLDLLLDLAGENKMSDENIREQVDNFMFAGHETLSTILSFSVYELAKHPEVQESILEEINTELKNISKPSLTDLQRLSYLDCVIKECLRKYPPVPMVERELKHDIEVDGVVIPAIANISIMIYALHHSPDSFPEPEKFDPERFRSENCVGRHPYAYVPFSAGPRNCIGQRYALLAVKVLLMRLIQSFEIYSVENFEVILGNDSVLKSSNGIWVKFKKRTQLK